MVELSFVREGKERSRAALDEGKASSTRIDERLSDAELIQHLRLCNYAQIFFFPPRTLFSL